LYYEQAPSSRFQRELKQTKFQTRLSTRFEKRRLAAGS
jgi:hypothetical protein